MLTATKEKELKNECHTDENIFDHIREFAKSYKGHPWSYGGEMFGNDNCHEFQKNMIRKFGFKYFKNAK